MEHQFEDNMRYIIIMCVLSFWFHNAHPQTNDRNINRLFERFLCKTKETREDKILESALEHFKDDPEITSIDINSEKDDINIIYRWTRNIKGDRMLFESSSSYKESLSCNEKIVYYTRKVRIIGREKAK